MTQNLAVPFHKETLIKQLLHKTACAPLNWGAERSGTSSMWYTSIHIYLDLSLPFIRVSDLLSGTSGKGGSRVHRSTKPVMWREKKKTPYILHTHTKKGEKRHGHSP